MADQPEAGGFLYATLPSPPASTITSPSVAPSILPSPRNHPLKPGSSKESNFMEYVDRKLLEISGRYERRFNITTHQHSEQKILANGYENFGELAMDLENVIDVIWVSGTRTCLVLVTAWRTLFMESSSVFANPLSTQCSAERDHISTIFQLLSTTYFSTITEA